MCKCLIFKMYIYYRKFWGEKYLADCSNYGIWWILLWQFKQDSYSPTSIVQCSLAVEILVDCSQTANLPNKFPAKFPAVHICIFISSYQASAARIIYINTYHDYGREIICQVQSEN